MKLKLIGRVPVDCRECGCEECRPFPGMKMQKESLPLASQISEQPNLDAPEDTVARLLALRSAHEETESKLNDIIREQQTLIEYDGELLIGCIARIESLQCALEIAKAENKKLRQLRSRGKREKP